MAGHEEETQLILNRLGEDARKILEAAGINVTAAIGEVLEEREWQIEVTRSNQLIELRRLPVQDVLTSELVQLCMLPDENLPEYRQELQRRLSLLELTDEQKKIFVTLDLAALEKKDPQMKRTTLAVGYHIIASTTPETLPDPTTCLTSELVMVIDDANAAWARDHEWLPDAAINAIGVVQGKYHFDSKKQEWVVDDKGPFLGELDRRFDLMGLEFWQRNSFVKNESLITARAKWGYEPSEKSWTLESIEKEEK